MDIKKMPLHSDTDIKSQKAFIVRQDRIECDPDRHSLRLSDGKIAKVTNFSSFGLAIVTDFELSDQINDCCFFVDDYPINYLSLTKVRQIETIPGNIITAFAIIGDPLNVDTVESIKILNIILEDTNQSINKDLELNETFRLKVLEIKDILLRLEEKINSLSKSANTTDIVSIKVFEDQISNRVSNFLSSTLNSFYLSLKDSIVNVNHQELEVYFEFFRKNVGNIMFKSAYSHRAFYKPRGYAGDYEMMNQLYTRDLIGDTLFSKCLQRYFVDEPAGRAVRNREKYLGNKIINIINKDNSDKMVRILSIASGPAMEIQNLISDQNFQTDYVEFHLLDQDQDSLKHAQRKIFEIARIKNKKVNLKLHNISISTVIQDGLNIGEFNLIYSAGLFDYFTDPVAVFAANQIYKALKRGGSLIIGNFSINNPNQFAMGLIMDWHLIYRSEQKMQALFGKIGSEYKLEHEEEFINLFANITK